MFTLEGLHINLRRHWHRMSKTQIDDAIKLARPNCAMLTTAGTLFNSGECDIITHVGARGRWDEPIKHDPITIGHAAFALAVCAPLRKSNAIYVMEDILHPYSFVIAPWTETRTLLRTLTEERDNPTPAFQEMGLMAYVEALFSNVE